MEDIRIYSLLVFELSSKEEVDMVDAKGSEFLVWTFDVEEHTAKGNVDVTRNR
jgi:hypothetical protein